MRFRAYAKTHTPPPFIFNRATRDRTYDKHCSIMTSRKKASNTPNINKNTNKNTNKNNTLQPTTSLTNNEENVSPADRDGTVINKIKASQPKPNKKKTQIATLAFKNCFGYQTACTNLDVTRLLFCCFQKKKNTSKKKYKNTKYNTTIQKSKSTRLTNNEEKRFSPRP